MHFSTREFFKLGKSYDCALPLLARCAARRGAGGEAGIAAMTKITLKEIAYFLNDYFGVEDYPGEISGIYRPSERPLRRIGLALEAWPELPDWIETQQLDALFLHRPWKLDMLLDEEDKEKRRRGEEETQSTIENRKSKIENLGVLFYHLPFDEYLTPGDSPRLADALLLSDTEVLGDKEGRPLGMIGDLEPQTFATVLAIVESVFGGYEEVLPCVAETVTRIAVVGAMTEALVREAGERGAQAYLTGQFRTPARSAIQELGMGVIAVGHRRSEEWGLRALAGLLRERFAKLEVVVYER